MTSRVSGRHSSQGLTLVELMFATFILVVVTVGVFQVYILCFNLTETSNNLTLAVQEAQAKIEEIRAYDFGQIYSYYTDPNNSIFQCGSFPDGSGIGVIYIDNSISNLLNVTVTICWLGKGGKVVGEDINLNGGLDSGEDINGNGLLDSPAQIVTLIAER